MLKKLFLILTLLLLVVPTLAQDTDEEEEEYYCPAFTSASAVERTSYYMGEGSAYMQRGDYTAAINSYGCIITEIDASYRDAYLNRAAAYSERRIYEEAIEDYDEAIRLDSSFAPSFNNRAIVYMAMEEYDDARSDFNQAINLDSNYTAAYINRGILLGTLEEYDAAQSDFERAIDIAGLADIVAELRDPDRPDDAEFPIFDRNAARAYALIGIVESHRALASYDDYMILLPGRADGRIQSAAGALRSRFNFELRFDNGTWMLVADFIER